MENEATDHPLFTKRERCKQGFARFNSIFIQAGTQHGFEYCDSAGPNIGRALRKDDIAKRGVFLELERHWSHTNEENPEVVLAFMIQYRTRPDDPLIHTFTKTYYQGGLNDLSERALLEFIDQACNDVMAVELSDVLTNGKIHDTSSFTDRQDS